jgi:hypothetical protein
MSTLPPRSTTLVLGPIRGIISSFELTASILSNFIATASFIVPWNQW